MKNPRIVDENPSIAKGNTGKFVLVPATEGFSGPPSVQVRSPGALRGGGQCCHDGVKG